MNDVHRMVTVDSGEDEVILLNPGLGTAFHIKDFVDPSVRCGAITKVLPDRNGDAQVVTVAWMDGGLEQIEVSTEDWEMREYYTLQVTATGTGAWDFIVWVQKDHMAVWHPEANVFFAGKSEATWNAMRGRMLLELRGTNIKVELDRGVWSNLGDGR